MKIRKRFQVGLLAVFTMLLMVGCVKVNDSITVAHDGSATMKLIIAVDKDYQAFVEQQGGLEEAFDVDNYKDQGFTTSQYSDDKYFGIAATKSVADVEELSEDGITFTLSGTEPKILKVSGALDLEGSMEAQGQDISMLSSMKNFEMIFELNLPGPASSHNATEVLNEGRTLKWDLVKAKTIEAEASLVASGSKGLLIGGIAGGVILIGVVILILVLHNRKKATMVATPAPQVAAPVPQPEPTAQATKPEKPEVENEIERHIRETVEKYKKD